MDKFIQGAIKEGYKNEVLFSNGDMKYQHSREVILLDPEFWKLGGKSEGWGKGLTKFGKSVVWKRNWHDFIDHLANGGEINSFFEDLLNKK